MTSEDIRLLKKWGLNRYIEGMTIEYVLPPVPVLPNLSKLAKQRLKWMDHYRQSNNAALTCRYFGISRKTLHTWLKRYNPNDLLSLEERSRRPQRVRPWQVAKEEASRILALRKQHIRYGNEKRKVIYERV